MKSGRPEYQIAYGKWVVNAEARRDSKGRIRVYPLPASDGGGTYEVAGINDRYDPQMAPHLRNLVQLGQQAQVEIDAADYILGNTDGVQSWSKIPAIEIYLRDCCFNRGLGGASQILQIALGHAHADVKVDGHVGPITLGYLSQVTNVKEFLGFLRSAREIYERRVAPPVGKRAEMWNGLVNRWNNSLAFALKFA
ncbi:hypothetical protein [Prosthecobacter sp.]|uniref:hypothetical protein n=1 Tax=Prosthecobacter sp. TaxID=1965333 RepID=UPI0037850939